MRARIVALVFALVMCRMGGPAVADVPYCADLKRLIDLAGTKQKFGCVAGRPREGNFRDTTMPLAGWRDCSLYGSRTYTCDSEVFATAGEANKALAAIVNGVKDCLGEEWAKDESRSSAVYVVVRNEHDAVSMTLSTDVTGEGGHVVRLTLFLRGR